MAESIIYISELLRIITGALRLDLNKVRNYTNFLAEKFEESGEKTTANRLRKLLEETENQLHPAKFNYTLPPVDSETRFPLAEVFEPQNLKDSSIILSTEQKEVVSEYISIMKTQSAMELAGINASSSLLLYGPPGCGKSCLARYIASELGYKLVIGRLDGLISSYVGNTAKNIRSIFEFASNLPCVLFLDELDAIAKLRDDTQEIGELKRVVNSFLQNLDSLGPQTIVIAATNHPQLLDTAVWRRFSYRLELSYPDYDMRIDLWTTFLKDKIAFSKNEICVLSDISEGFSGSDIKEICLKLFRYRFVNKKDVLLNDAYSYVHKFVQGNKESYPVLNLISNLDEKQKAKILKQRNDKLYTSSILAALLETSRATASRWAKEGE